MSLPDLTKAFVAAIADADLPDLAEALEQIHAAQLDAGDEEQSEAPNEPTPTPAPFSPSHIPTFTRSHSPAAEPIEPNPDTPTPPHPDTPPQPSRPISQAKLRANRENAKKSTGPRTPEGKARSARNALKHGLLTQHVIPEGDLFETQEAYDALLDGLTDQYEPTDLFETLCVRRITNCFWRLDRALRFECQAIESARDNLKGNVLADFAQKVLGTPSPDPDRHVLPADPDLARLVRYESMIDRELQHALKQLRDHRAETKADPFPRSHVPTFSPSHSPTAAQSPIRAPSASEAAAPHHPPHQSNPTLPPPRSHIPTFSASHFPTAAPPAPIEPNTPSPFSHRQSRITYPKSSATVPHQPGGRANMT